MKVYKIVVTRECKAKGKVRETFSRKESAESCAKYEYREGDVVIQEDEYDLDTSILISDSLLHLLKQEDYYLGLYKSRVNDLRGYGHVNLNDIDAIKEKYLQAKADIKAYFEN